MQNAIATAVTTAANLGTALQALIGQSTPTFISVLGYTNKKGEVANHVINIGAKYENAQKRDVTTLTRYISELTSVEGYGATSEQATHLRAANELLASVIKNQDPATRSTQSEAQRDTYTTLGNLRIHNGTGEIYVAGFAVGKKILEAGEYKEVNSGPVVVQKNAITKALNLSTAKRRQFIIGNVQEIAINGNRLVLGTNGHTTKTTQEAEIQDTNLEG